MRKHGWKAMLLALAALVLVSWPAQAREPGDEVDGVVPWVSQIDGKDDSLLVRQPDTDWFEGTENTPIGEGDQVWQDKGGRSEIYLDRTTYVRLDENSGVQFDSLGNDEVRLIVTKGSAEVSNGKGGPIYVDLPGQTVTVQPNTKMRVKVNDDGTSEVKVRKGEARVQGPNGTTRVNANGRLLADEDGSVDRLERDTGKDSFDKWNDKRDARLGTFYAPPTRVAADLPEPAAYEMSENGTWINDPQYGWVWSPNVEPDWAPYRAGRWTYRPAWGWTWVSYEPWGWYPYHYGRWVHVHHGWAWAPVAVVHHRWHPGLVFWVEGPDFIAWQPIPYGVSVAVVHTWGPTYIDAYVVPAYVTVVSYDHFHYCNYYRYARPWPGHCVSGCYIHSYPRHYDMRGRDNVRYRTPRPSGYLSSSRSPRDNVVYAGGRHASARGGTGRASYGTPSRPGRVAGVNDHGRITRADNRGGSNRGNVEHGRTAPNNRTNPGASRPAPGNRANPGEFNRQGGQDKARPTNSRTSASNRGNANRPTTGPRENPGAARPDHNRTSSGSNTASTRPAPGNRENPGVAHDRYGSTKSRSARNNSSASRPNNGAANRQPASSGPATRPNNGAGNRPNNGLDARADNNENTRPNNGANRTHTAPGAANPQPRTNTKKNKANRNNNSNNDSRGNSSSYSAPSSPFSSSHSAPSYSSPSSSRPSYSAPSRSSGSSGSRSSHSSSHGSSRGSSGRSPRHR